MKKAIAPRVSLSLLLLMICACSSDEGPGDPPADDDDSLGDDDSGDDDDDSGDDDDTTAGVPQSPIVFTVINDSDGDRYFQWLEMLSEHSPVSLSCALQLEDSSWEACTFVVPYTSVECTPEVEDGYCHHEVDGGEAVYLLPPGRSLDIPWDGKRWLGDPEYCADGVCYWPHDPLAGHYGVSVMMWDDMWCLIGECPEPGEEGGVVNAAVPTGNSATHHVEFDLPYAEQGLTIHVE